MKLSVLNVNRRAKTLYGITIILSGIFALLQSGPLFGSKIALILTVIAQLYLPGLLLARALGKLNQPHPLARFAWVLLAGLSLTICLGMLARLLQIPVPVYVLLLHGGMLLLAWLPSRPITETDNWRFSKANILLYLLLALCCVIIFSVGLERSRFRFNGYEDQTVFISLADWLANDPDDRRVIDRRIGVPEANLDFRWHTDGWTYTHAAWVWSSGVPAADLIWHDLTPLFIWTVPLAVFGLAYEITRREEAAIWSVVALTLVGLLTLDSLVYNPTTIAFGQFALFQLNTLRTFSTALMLPLVLIAGLNYLRQPDRASLLLSFLGGLALATLHPRQIVIFQISLGATVIIWWLAQPNRKRARQGLLLLIVLVSLAALPFVQRLNRPSVHRNLERIEQAIQATTQTDEALTGNESENTPPNSLLVLDNLPLIGTTYIVNPRTVLYHPAIILAMGLGLGTGWWWRRSLAAQYLFAATLALLAVLFLPGLTEGVARVISTALLAGLIFVLPVPLIFGLAVDALLQRLPSNRWLQSSAGIAAAGAIFVLLIEPFPLPASARDQIYAANTIQVTRDIQPFDQALLTTLRDILPDNQRSILITPEHPANYVIESVAHTFILGGRASSNEAYGRHSRFLTRQNRFSRTTAPWLDASDITNTLNHYGITHIVLQASDTRLTQLLLQPQRFTLLAQPAGFYIFSVQPDIEPNTYDTRFEQMNTLYDELDMPRWQPTGFQLPLPANTEAWQALAEAWEADQSAGDDYARYGLAFTWLMMGQDAQALPLWENLQAAYPDIPLFNAAVAHTRRQLDPAPAALNTLLAALDSDQAAVRVMAARDLLTETFFYLLTPDQLAQVLAVAESDALVWWQLAQFDQWREIRQQIALMLSAGQHDVALRWLDSLPIVERSPQDLNLQAYLLLAQGQTEAAQAALVPALDAGWVAPNASIHPDRWQQNTSADLYHQLTTNPTGDTAPQVIAQTGQLFAMLPQITQTGDQLTVTATFANPYPAAYPVNTWRIEITSPDASVRYGALDTPAAFDEPALTRAALTVDLAADIPPLTPALVFIQPLHSETVTYPGLIQPITLNKPPTAVIPAEAVSSDYQFADQINLQAYQVAVNEDGLEVTLYWQAAEVLAADYQVFVHVLDETGATVAQRDSGPVDDRYPTSHWLNATTIEDTHILPLPESLPAGDYQVMIGLYRLDDFTRLPITPADESIQSDSLRIAEFQR